jgi:hypothetical protein
MDNYQQQSESITTQYTQEYQSYYRPPEENIGKKGLIFSILGLILIWFPILDIIFWVKGAKKSYKGYKENSGRNQAVAGLVFTAIAAHLYLLFLSYLFLALYGLIWGASFAHRLGAF